MANLSVCCSGTNYPIQLFLARAALRDGAAPHSLWRGAGAEVRRRAISGSNAQEPDTTPVETPLRKTIPAAKSRTASQSTISIGSVCGASARGINFYSLEKEQRLGESLAKRLDRHTKFVPDPSVTDYVNRLGQKLARNSDAHLPFTIKVIDSEDTRVFALPAATCT